MSKKEIGVLGVIPARGGSKGLKRKNVKELAGRPLIAHTIESALNCDLIDKLIVSTDDEEIAEEAKKHGAEVPFIRPKELGKDEVSIIPVMKHALEFFENKGLKIKYVASIQPTSPLMTAEDIDSAIEKIQITNCDSVVSVTKMHEHPYRAMKLEGDKLEPLYPDHEKYLQRQDLPEFYKFNGALYVRKTELLKNWSGKDFGLGKDVRAVVFDEEKSADVHTETDLKMIEFLLEKKSKD